MVDPSILLINSVLQTESLLPNDNYQSFSMFTTKFRQLFSYIVCTYTVYTLPKITFFNKSFAYFNNMLTVFLLKLNVNYIYQQKISLTDA